MRVLVTGSHGLLGAAISREFSSKADVVSLGHRELDVSNEAAVSAAMADVRPNVVINCAAYNDVDGAEERPVDALQVNAFGVMALARASALHDAALVHYSSDFVFDGQSTSPYAEGDAPNPRGVYAASKLLGDWFALDRGKSWVLRVESLFGHPAPGASRVGSLGTIVRRIQSGEEVPVFVDRTVSPSYTADVASATRALLEGAAAPGLYHCVNSGAATWAEVAAEAARLLGVPLRMKPITLESVSLKAPRPRYCALSNAKLAAAGVQMRTWQSALEHYLRQPPIPSCRRT
jgi:dTDP-4-dehydrorhamnose reductase